jgi:hypothetical protein
MGPVRIIACLSQPTGCASRPAGLPAGTEELIKRIAALPPSATGKQNPERVQAALVLAARGQWRWFNALLRLLDQDWRDVLVAGDLADADWPARLDAELPDR